MNEQVDLPAEWFNAPKALVHANGLAALSPRQNRLVMIIAGALHAQKYEPKETKVKFSIPELMENYPSNERHIEKLYDDLKSVRKNADIESITRNPKTGEMIHAQCANFLGSVTIDAESGFVNLTVPSLMMAMIHTPDAWGTINKTAWLQINSKHSQRLYQLIADQEGKGNRKSRVWAVELDEFVDLMQIPEAGKGSYRRKGGVFSFGDFNKYALKPALAEVNAMGIFKVEIEAKRRGRNVRRLFFTWAPKVGIPAVETAKETERHSSARGKKQEDNDASPLTDGQKAFAWWEMLTDVQKSVQMERHRYMNDGRKRPEVAVYMAAWTAHMKEQRND